MSEDMDKNQTKFLFAENWRMLRHQIKYTISLRFGIVTGIL